MEDLRARAFSQTSPLLNLHSHRAKISGESLFYIEKYVILLNDTGVDDSLLPPPIKSTIFLDDAEHCRLTVRLRTASTDFDSSYISGVFIRE